ncbi:hypothetical protein M3Y94_01209900 [Aphelenchoides besseyi]|nr:hypothetical protein M3Y94_01209900 [Aphelenchoides besseyi]
MGRQGERAVGTHKLESAGASPSKVEQLTGSRLFGQIFIFHLLGGRSIMILRWRMNAVDRFLVFVFLSLSLLNNFDSAASVSPKIWLLQPQSRILERDPKTVRLAEAKCPTMKKANDPTTTLTAGGVIDVVWANPSNISGPSKFELLNGDEILTKLDISESDSAESTHEEGKSTMSLKLPDFNCKSCVLRLTQSTPDGEMEFISCADVQIAHLADGANTTSNSLQISNPDCSIDTDCGANGLCVHKTCYCGAGEFGRKCDKKSQFKSMANDNEYSTVALEGAAKGNALKWRYDKQAKELEFVVNMPNSSWSVIGLRNKEAGAKCAELLKSRDANSVDLDAENTIAPSLHIQKIVSNYLSTTTPFGSSECGPFEEYSECPEFSRECEPSCEWTAFPESVPVCPKACRSTPACVCKEGYVRESNEKSACRPFEFCSSIEPEISKCAGNQTWAKCGTACEPTCENMYNTDPCTASCEEPACSCADNYVRKDGQCIFWSDCPDLEERVLNSEGPDASETLPKGSKSRTIEQKKSCPVNETFNSCGRECETDCVSIFDRTECSGCAAASCACQQGFARLNGSCVYWGDCPGNHKESGDPEIIQKFTTLAANAVAGTDQSPTGSNKSKSKSTTASPQTLNSAEMPSADPEMLCFGEFEYPPRCEGSECRYRLSWAYVPEEDNVEFSLETQMNGTNRWSGIGFSRNGKMQDADFVIVKSDGRQLSIVDMHADGYSKIDPAQTLNHSCHLDSPIVDEVQDVESANAVGTQNDGILKATFLRKRRTEDIDEDASFGDSDDDCHYFLFPIDGGELTKDGAIAPHVETPLVSSRRICIRACNGQTTSEDRAEPPKPKIPTYTCQNEFRFPANCTEGNCDYQARWAYDQRDQAVMFEIKAKGVGRWTGIGWSRDGEMTNSDIYLGWYYGKKAYVLDRFAYSRQLPVADPSDRQDLYDVGGRVEDDYQTISFKRKLVTADKKTDLPLDRCYYFLFPVGGGRILTRKPSDFENSRTPIGFHDQQTPERSAIPVCICSENGRPVGETPPVVIRQRRQAAADPFDERSIAPGDLSHLLPAVRKRPANDPKDDAFACTDVALIELNNGRVRALDAFALDSTSIQPDESFNGLQSLQDIGVIAQKNGDATVVLRKSINTDDIADLNIENEVGTLVFASGPMGTILADAPYVKSVDLNLLDQATQVAETTTVTSTTTSEETESTTQSTEKEVEETTTETVKKVTTTKKSTTSTTSTTTSQPTTTETSKKTTEQAQKTVAPAISADWIADESDSNCAGSFYFPSNCHGASCTYVANWAVNEQRTDLRVHLEAMLSTSKWTSIGFSSDGGMPNSDAVIVLVQDDSTVKVVDQYNKGYGRPSVDQQQDLRDVSSAYVDGRVVVNFVRALTTNDEEDVDLLDDCYYVVFVPTGGEISGSDLRKHIETPTASRNRFCPSKCRAVSKEPENAITSQDETTTAETTTTSQKKTRVQTSGGAVIPPIGQPPAEDRIFDTVLRVMGRDWGVHLENMESPEAKVFTSEIIDSLKPVVEKRWKSLKSIDVTNYAYSTTESVGVTEQNHGIAPSILALTQFTFGPKDAPDAVELREFLKEAMAQSLNGQLNVDPNAVQVKPNEKHEEDEKWGPLRAVINWALIGTVILVFLTLIFACLCCGFRGRRKTHPEPLSFGQPSAHHASYHHFAASSYPTVTYDTSKGTDVATASTDSQNPNSSGSGTMNRNENVKTTAPKGIGETTYAEWRNKVASKDTPLHYQESTYQTPPTRMITGPHSGAYVTYPNDQNGYYTLNGQSRIPPPGYYHYQ